jgi:hypothetical protein
MKSCQQKAIYTIVDMRTVLSAQRFEDVRLGAQSVHHDTSAAAHALK